MTTDNTKSFNPTDYHDIISACVFQGCDKNLEKYVDDHLILIGAVGIGLSCVQVRGKPDEAGSDFIAHDP